LFHSLTHVLVVEPLGLVARDEKLASAGVGTGWKKKKNMHQWTSVRSEAARALQRLRQEQWSRPLGAIVRRTPTILPHPPQPQPPASARMGVTYSSPEQSEVSDPRNREAKR
jgi:hypothetical protein